MKTKQLSLPNTIASPQDLLQVTLEVKLYAKWYAHETIRQRVSKKKGAPAPSLSPSARQVITDWNEITELSTRSFSTLITTLEIYARQTETITITLAAPAPASVKQPLIAWCRQNISPQIFVSFQFNSTLLGGMVVRHGSRVFDWSFKRQLLAASSSFPEVLRRV
ncbi:F0F1 ATP synthase subunit delta [Candidatus Saccharibacteria bacterium]|nr:F0F1 ATP synthase subunit delta [Candidatus Saccharibacteria bacterium]